MIKEQIVRIETDGNETRAEVVGEIVRCKDCKYSFTRELGYGCYLDYRLGTNGNWFCADGERKETEDDMG